MNASDRLSLTIQRGDLTPFTIYLTKKNNEINPIEWRIQNDNIAYIHVFCFNEKTSEEFEKILKKIQSKKIKGLIIDLRNNPGGLLDEAIQMCRFFIENGKIVEIRGRHDDEVFEAIGKDWMYGIPMILLINGRSASASEIMAGALKDHKRAIIMGERSYGKGSVQNQIDLSQGGILLTTAHFYTPDGHIIHKKGIAPDIIMNDVRDKIFTKEDPLILRAIEVLQNKQ
jgi:carboxyl-terminal processing protease